MNDFLADCRHAVRLYVRTPWPSLIAVLVLAIGIAFVGAFLSLYVDLILRPHPGFEQSRQIATVGQNTGTNLIGLPYELVDRLASEMASIEAAAMVQSAFTLAGPEQAETDTAMVSREFFSGLRPRLAFGRGFQVEDHAIDAEPVVVLSHRYWMQRFNGDRDVLGRFLEIARDPTQHYQGPNIMTEAEPEQESAQFRIVGVMAEASPYPPGADGASFVPEVWIPLERVWSMFMGVPEVMPGTLAPTYVRRSPGVPAAAVSGELTSRYSSGDSQFEGRLPGTQLDAIDGMVFNITVQRDAKRQLEMFLAASVLLTLVAAANVSLFLLARAPGRRRELGIRMAVGAPIRRLARQLATEGGFLVAVSVVPGIFGSIWLSLYLRSLAFLREAEWQNVTLLDWRVLSLTSVMLLVLTLLVSLAPILGIERLGIGASSRQATARASLAQRLAGTAQIAVAGTLGGAAIAFGWHLGSLMFGDPGFEITDRYWVRSSAQNSSVSPDTQTIETARWRDAVETIPGVTAVAFGRPVPGSAQNTRPATQISNPIAPTSEVEVYLGEIERSFIDLLELRLLHGRAPEDREPWVLVVNQTLARAIWGRENVVGEYLSGDPRFRSAEGGGSEIIGVIEDVSFGHPSAPAKPYAFESGANFRSAVIETGMTSAELQQALNSLDSTELNIQVSSVRPLRTMRDELLATDRARAFLTIATTSIVVFLAAFGFYGTQRYLVATARREYAIHASLGAGPRALGRLVVSRGLLLALPGMLIGGLLAYVVTALLRDDFVSRNILPGLVTIWVVAGLGVLLVTASLAPAREVRRIQPAPLLRED